MMNRRAGRHALLLTATAFVALTTASGASAQTLAASEVLATAAASDATSVEGVVVSIASQTTRSAVAIGTPEIQKILPGASPLLAIQTLPGVLYLTADPWGNNEQNTSLFVHGFSTQQLGFTLDGVPLGDQQYGNYNGLSPQRAVISEDVGRVVLSSGAGDLATASTSNLGGAIDTFTSDPKGDFGVRVAQLFGSYSALRSYVRVDTGAFGPNGSSSAYLSYLHQDQRAWDFNAHQRGNQVNGKYIFENDRGKFTAFIDYSDKKEPNEDAIVHVAGELSAPYTRPFLFPDYNAGIAYLSNAGAPPASAGSNFSNYHSAAQRTDWLGYAKYDYKLSDALTWSNQGYYHHDKGRGIVAGPINQAGLPALFSIYYPGQNLKTVFGGSGYAVRTTEYLIDRSGYITNLDWTLGDHKLEAGLWYEHNKSSTHRVWYPFTANSTDLTPYQIPTNANFTQYASQIRNNVVQLHLQDEWTVVPTLRLQAGFKSSLQFAQGTVPVQQQNLPGAANPTLLPTGTINTRKWFLPQIGGIWDVTPRDQVFVNVQKNLRQFVTYGAGGLSPWSLGSQAAFNLFKANTKPEQTWTYEAGLRTRQTFGASPMTSLEAQVSVYHVDFSNRLLQISSTPVISSLVAGAAILANVGGVKTNGIDLAATMKFGSHFSIYDALSYNRSIYQDNYTSGASNAVVPTAGKKVPASPSWLNKTVAAVNFGHFEAQLVGDYVGKRYATYTNDLSVKSYFLVGLEAGYRFDLSDTSLLKTAKVSLNLTNLTGEKGAQALTVGAASGTYNAFPIPPTQAFVTFSAGF